MFCLSVLTLGYVFKATLPFANSEQLSQAWNACHKSVKRLWTWNFCSNGKSSPEAQRKQLFHRIQIRAVLGPRHVRLDERQDENNEK